MSLKEKKTHHILRHFEIHVYLIIRQKIEAFSRVLSNFWTPALFPFMQPDGWLPYISSWMVLLWCWNVFLSMNLRVKPLEACQHVISTAAICVWTDKSEHYSVINLAILSFYIGPWKCVRACMRVDSSVRVWFIDCENEMTLALTLWNFPDAFIQDYLPTGQSLNMWLGKMQPSQKCSGKEAKVSK